MSLYDETQILLFIEASREKLTPGRLIRMVAAQTHSPEPVLKKALRRLVDQGTLTYTQCFGSTCIEISYARPIQITDHFTLTPPEFADVLPATPGTIIIEPGISFGSGSHPTTRLCLRGLDYLLFNTLLFKDLQPVKAADIGTGSGVLAIAAMKLLAGTCTAVDTNPNCVAEARRNMIRNNLHDRVRVLESMFEPAAQGPDLSLILANLRFPTLKSLAPAFRKSTRPGAILILSGIRTTEIQELIQTYIQLGFDCLWQNHEQDWAGVILH